MRNIQGCSFRTAPWLSYTVQLRVVGEGPAQNRRFDLSSYKLGLRSAILAAIFEPPVQWTPERHTCARGRTLVLRAPTYDPRFTPTLEACSHFIGFADNPHDDNIHVFSNMLDCLGPFLRADMFQPGDMLMLVGCKKRMTNDFMRFGVENAGT